MLVHEFRKGEVSARFWEGILLSVMLCEILGRVK